MDKHNWYYRFLADTDWLNDHHGDIEDSFWNLLLELTEDTGVVYGFDVSERGAGQNFSVDVSSGVSYDTYGRRIINDATTNVEFSEDESGDPIEVVSSGNERIVSIYAYYNTTDSDPAIDGFGDTVYQITTEDAEFKLYQGAEDTAGNANPAANPGDGGVLLAHITISYGDTTVEDADIDTSVKEELTILGYSGFVHDEGDETIDGNWSFYNGSTITFYSDEGITQTFQIDGATGDITTSGTVDGVDVSDHDHSGAGQGGTVDHENLSSIGSYNHTDIDNHIDDATLHFTEASIDHGSISGLGDDDHPQYAGISQTETISGAWSFTTAPTSVTPTSGSHVATKDYVDATVITDHGSLGGLGDDDHPQYAGISQSETISGSWSFSSIPSCGVTPSSGSHLANKSYVDSAISGSIISDHGSLSGLSDDDHPQYLRTDGSRTLTGNMSVSGGIEIDGVDIGSHTHDVSINLSVSRQDRANYDNLATQDNTYTIAGYDSGDFAICAITNLALHNNNFSSDNYLRIGSTTISTLSGYDWLGSPNYSGSNWNFRIMTGAGNDDQIAAFFYGVMSDDDTDVSSTPN